MMALSRSDNLLNLENNYIEIQDELLKAHSMQNPTTYFCRGLPRIWQKIVAKMFWKPLKLDTLSKKLLRKHTL